MSDTRANCCLIGLFRTPDLVKQTNEWLKRLDIGYAVDPRPVGTQSSDLFDMLAV